VPDPYFTFAADVHPICQIGTGETRVAEPAWLDVSCYVHQAELFRGRERFNERFEPGTASVTFSNADGWADLGGTYTQVAAAPLRPGRHIRIGIRGPWSAGLAPYVRWLYRGFIDQATPRYDPVLHDTVTVQCIDALGESGSSTAPTAALQGVNETASQRINRVLDAVGWWGTKRKIDPTTTTVQGTELGAAAIDHMGQAADSAGGVVFGDLDGDVVFHDIDWMLYDPATPPDDTIGPGDPGAPPGDTPPYIDPTPGPVYDPDDPPSLHPPKVCVCADGDEGTLVEKGDNYRLYVRDGHLYYETSGTTWDMGPYEGGCTCVDPTPDGGGGPERSDDPDEDGDYDINPFPPVELPAEFGVELLAWSDGGLADPPAASVTVTGVTPGHDCLLVVLINALGTLDNPGGLVPVITDGADLLWTRRRAADQPADGASSFIDIAPIGRDDPGTFDVTVTWATGMTSRSHIVTVWKVVAALDNYLERFDAGLVLYAVTDSNPPDEIEPGDGPNTVDLAADAQPDDVEVLTRTVDITIAQTLAEEATGPFGAVFAELDPPWIYPPNVPPLPEPGLLVTPTFSDDFERADGALGANWVPPGGYPAGLPANTVPTIASGAAVAATGTDAVTVYAAAIPGDHYIEAEITNWHITGTSPTRQANIGVFTRCAADAFTCFSARWQMAAAQDGGSIFSRPFDAGVAGIFTITFISPAETFRLRLESTVAGHHAMYIDDILAYEAEELYPGGGDLVGFWINWSGGGTSPRINSIDIGGLLPARKTSWNAAWRQGAATTTVQLADVNTGVDNIQSAQAALVVESAETESGWRILGHQAAATLTGVTAAGTFTFTQAPRPGALVVVFVGVTASTDVTGSVAVTGADFTTARAQPKSGSSWGQGAVYTAIAPLDMTEASWAVLVTYPGCESVSAVVYEVTDQDDEAPVGATASGVLGTGASGSVNGASTITLTAAGDPAAVVLAYLHVAATPAAGNGAATVDGDEWHEEYQSPGTAARAYYQTMSRAPGQPESTSTAVHWDDVQTGTGPAFSGVQLAVEVHPYDGLPPLTGGGSGVALGGINDPWNGTISSAGAYNPDGSPIWQFP
jgi:hypothetical protein